MFALGFIVGFIGAIALLIIVGVNAELWQNADYKDEHDRP